MKNSKKVVVAIRRIIASIVWCYLLTNSFIISIDALFYKILPETLSWVITYKVVFLLIIAILFTTILDKKRLAFNVLYLLTFPIVLCFLFLKNYWTSIIPFIPVISAYFRRLKIRFIAASLAIISLIIIASNFNSFISLLAGILLWIYICLHLYFRFQSLFMSENVFRIFTEKLRVGLESPDINKYILSAAPTNVIESQVEKPSDRKHGITTILFINALISEVIKKVQNFHEKRTLDLYAVIATVYTSAVIIICYAFIYLSLFHFDNTLFLTKEQFVPSIFAFINLSFYHFLSQNLASIDPASDLIYFIFITESFMAYFIAGSILYAFASSFRERYREDTQKFINALTGHIEKNTNTMFLMYGVRVKEAYEEVGVDFSNMSKILSYMRELGEKANNPSNNQVEIKDT